MASTAIDLLIGRIFSAVENEASLIGGVRDDLEELGAELGYLRSFLEDAQRTRDLTEVEKSSVTIIRDIVDDVEDLMEEFMYHTNEQYYAGGRFKRLLYKALHFPKSLWVRHQLATKIQKLKRRITAASERRNRNGGLTNATGSNSSSHHDAAKWMQIRSENALFIKDEQLVGIEEDKRILMEVLTDEKERRCKTVSVVGMGGSGKTTLVAQVYNDKRVKQHFDCHAWITVSQKYDAKDLLRRMIKDFHGATEEEIPKDIDTMERKGLVEKLNNFLRPKRYVLVLDDVWSSDLREEINVSLPDEERGSRVVLTTRDEDIASSSVFGVTGFVHGVKQLGEEDAWNLFCSRAFPNKCYPEELEFTARNLVEKCGGLPLALVALGGAMSTKRSESEWRRVKDGLEFELRSNAELKTMTGILLLSIDSLPLRLKRCFLYCCLFPEDYTIKVKRLIRLWMAQGFVEEVKGLTPEQVAETYVMQLICRSMLQVITKTSSGRPRRCKMHDLMRELALLISREEKFCDTYDRQEAKQERNRVNCLSFQPCDHKLKSWEGMPRLRSLLIFGIDAVSPSLEKFPSGFRYVRVLDLESVPITKLPNELGDLFNLRYLNLRHTKMNELPKSIERLRNLQTLDLAGAKIKELPTGITKLLNLRHLFVYSYNLEAMDQFDYVNGITAVSNMCRLKNLRSLSLVEAKVEFLRDVRSMTQLTRIGIEKVKGVHGEDLCFSVQHLRLLRRLYVMAADNSEILQMDALSEPPPHLDRIHLGGKLENVPRWFYSLQSLTHLSLHWSRLNEDPLPYIQQLPNLEILALINAYAGSKLVFGRGFLRLKELSLGYLSRLNEIIIEEGCMPEIESLRIVSCAELKKLPYGIEFLTQLRELYLSSVPENLRESAVKLGFEF